MADNAAPAQRRRMEVPQGLWIRCVSCGAMIYRRILEEELQVCPECDHHYRMDAPRAHPAAE